MDNLKKVSFNNTLLVENTTQHLTDEEAQALAARSSAYFDMLALTQETGFTPEMRQDLSDLRRQTARIMAGSELNVEGADIDLRTAALKRSDQISEILKDRIARREQLLRASEVKLSDITTMESLDHSFWWARTESHTAPDTWSEFRSDGLHFWGGPKVNNHNGSMDTSFGAVASFALQPERFPTSAGGLLLSSPYVELFGGIVAYAPNWDLLQGDGIAECKLFLRQTLWQVGFGQIIRAEAQRYDSWYIYLKNTGYSQYMSMPGFKRMPAVVYNQSQIAPQQLWAEIEVRFDIHLNSAGALVWCDPNVVLRTLQWEPEPWHWFL